MSKQLKTIVNPKAEDFTTFYESYGETLNEAAASSFVSTFEEVGKKGKPVTRYDRRNGLCFGFVFTRTSVLALVGDEKDVRKMLSNSKQKGFSLVEVIVALLVVVMIAVISSALLLSRSKTIENTTTTTIAENVAEDALSVLTAKVKDLPLGQSYQPIDESAVEIFPCTDQNCDYVLEPDAPAEQKTSIAGGVGFTKSYEPPQGYRIAFIRRWRVLDENTDYRLRRVGIAVFPTIQSTQSIVLQETLVAVQE